MKGYGAALQAASEMWAEMKAERPEVLTSARFAEREPREDDGVGRQRISSSRQSALRSGGQDSNVVTRARSSCCKR